MAELLVQDCRVTVAGEPAPIIEVQVTSRAEGLWAHLTSPATAPAPAVGAPLTVELGAGGSRAVVLSGEVTDVRRSDRVVRWRAEPRASRSLRGALADDEVGPFGWRAAPAAELAAAVLAGLPHDLRELPPARLRWSAPRAPRRWALAALRTSLTAATGVRLAAMVRTDGVLAFGSAQRLRRRTDYRIARPLRGPQATAADGGVTLLLPALPLAYGDLLHVDERLVVCRYSRLEVAAGRYRSRLVVEAA